MTRPYDHARNAGNRGDVWKHAVLLTAIEGLVGERGPDGSTFRYLETHSGRGVYKLPETGGWRQGVGRLSGGEPAHAYVRLAARHLQRGEYLGSWMLVRTRLGELGVGAAITLHDMSPEVAADVNGMITVDGLGDVTFHQADGFDRVHRQTANLVLIDPPYTPEPEPDWRRAIEAIQTLRAPALAWYPLLEHITFPSADLALPTFSVWWDGDGSPFIGCGVVSNRAAMRPLIEALPDLERVALQIGVACEVRVPP